MVRDSPSEEEHIKREKILLEMAGGNEEERQEGDKDEDQEGQYDQEGQVKTEEKAGALWIRQGQSTRPVTFFKHYKKNWKPCNFLWVHAF